MKEFDVTITETLEKNVKVEAESRQEAEDAVKKAYYNSEYVLDAENFTGVQFATQAERDIQQEQPTMDVLLVRPGMYPQQVQIGCELEDLQAAVGGCIQAVYPFEDPVAIICNEEGKLNGSELNRCLRDDEGQIYDILAGDFLITGLTEDDFGSLTPEQMHKFEKMFHQPEMFVKMGRSLMALPVPDDRVKKPDAPEKTDMIPKKSAPDRDVL